MGQMKVVSMKQGVNMMCHELEWTGLMIVQGRHDKP